MEQKKLMTPREKLVELIEDSINEWDFYLHHFDDERLYDDVSEEKKKSFEEFISDYLLENGVILPPCKVGDTVWEIEDPFFEDDDKGTVVESKVEQFYIGTSLDLIEMKDFDTYIFLTKEEAEKALAEKRADND